MMKIQQFLCVMAGLALTLVAVACVGVSSSESSKTDESENVTEKASSFMADIAPISINVTGDLNVNLSKSELVGRQASVSFSRFPGSLEEFESVLPTLKGTPQGAVAAQLMAMELYRRDRTAGEQAFSLCNVASNVPMIMRQVPDLFGYAGTGLDGGDSTRPYQVASFLQGATPANGYNPTLPYTVNVKVSVNGAIYSETYQAKVLYLQVESSGTDSGYRACEVINTKKPGEPTGWIVFNCPGLYVRCRDISFDSTFQGLN